MPKTDKNLCGVCSLVKFKYKCPNDGIPYCSVKCFQDHKDQAQCTGKKIQSIPQIEPNSGDEKQEESVQAGPVEEDCPTGILTESQDLKPLSALQWPTIDEEKEAVFYDPMRKDEIKPVRQHEWEQIATSAALRNLLMDKKELRDLLNQLIQNGKGVNQNHRTSKSPKDKIKQLLLRPDQAQSEFSFTSQQIKTFNEFADIVKDILTETRA